MCNAFGLCLDIAKNDDKSVTLRCMNKNDGPKNPRGLLFEWSPSAQWIDGYQGKVIEAHHSKMCLTINWSEIKEPLSAHVVCVVRNDPKHRGWQQQEGSFRPFDISFRN